MRFTKFIFITLSAAFTLIAGGCASSPAPTAYNTPDAAVAALVDAARLDKTAEMQVILGKDAQSVLSSGDPVDDANHRQDFVAAFDKRHDIQIGPEGTATLSVGNDHWPFPIPLVKGASGWTFDTAAGKEEIINRRIGRNELDTIEVCLAIVQAENEYRSINPEGIGAFAAKFFSDPGKKNGLYWPAADGQPDSPLGELVADASSEGYERHESGAPQPYHGYHYRILTAQGPAAPGGAYSYLVEGKLTRGFAVVAWPADYGNSGIVTFIVSKQGVVYQQDLGDQTESRAAAIKEFDPGTGWVVSSN